MALKFLNKKGWHTGSLRNIENVWKAEQKHEAEQKKLEELRKQIQDERERDEFRLLQEKAGILPRQERLEFLYDSGLAVGKGSNDGVVFKSLDSSSSAIKETSAAPAPSSAASASAASTSAVPGALFEEKQYSANDAWRKLHSDPLLMIRQREQEALARIKNNPVQMDMIRKSVAEKSKEKDHDKKEHKKKHRHRSSKHKKRSPSSPAADSDDSSEERYRRKKSIHESSKHRKRSPSPLPAYSDALSDKERYQRRKNVNESARSHDRYREERSHYDAHRQERGSRSFNEDSRQKSEVGAGLESHYKRGKPAPKLTEEERAARLREMQLDAEVHEEQRWKRLKKAAEDDAREARRDTVSRGKNFLDAAHKSVYGAEKGGSSTVEESVRRRTHYSQGSRGGEGNAFRRH